MVREQLHRLAGLDSPLVDGLVVEPVPGDDDGLAWRTRVQHAVSPRGRLGLREHRSHQVVEIEQLPDRRRRGCRTSSSASPQWVGAARVEVVAPAGGDKPLVLVEPVGRRRPVLPPASALDASRRGQHAGRPGAGARPDVGPRAGRGRRLARDDAGQRVRLLAGAPGRPGGAGRRGAGDAASPAPGEQALDLFAGVGLFAAALAERLGPDGAVLAVEGDPHAVRDARRNLHELTQVGITAGRVDRVLATVLERRADRGPRGARPAAGRRRTPGGRAGGRGAAARGRLRRLRPGRAGPRRADLRRARLPAGRPAGVRLLPDDPPHRVRRPPGARWTRPSVRTDRRYRA